MGIAAYGEGPTAITLMGDDQHCHQRPLPLLLCDAIMALAAVIVLMTMTTMMKLWSSAYLDVSAS